MALLDVEAEKLSLDDLRSGVIEQIITSDELFGIMPFIPTDGKAKTYNREATLGTADFVETGDIITEDSATFAKITSKLKRIVGDTDVDEFLEATMSDETDQAATQINKKAKVVGRNFAKKLIQGDETANPEEFDGLLKLCPAGQKFAAATNGAPLEFGFLDQLMDLVKIPGQQVFVMNSRTRRSYINLQRALGGTTPETISIGGRVFDAYRGVPILRNDNVPINETQGTETAATTLTLVTLDEDEGLTGMFSRNAMGIRVVDVGPVQDQDANRWRVKWYAGLVLFSELAIACVEGINN